MTSALRSFQEAPVRHLQLGGTNLAYRVFGQGPFLAAMRAADFRVLHPFLKPAVPTLCIWGAADPFFPLNRARAMVATWPTARLEVVEKAKLLVYEEAPELALAWMSPFLRSHLS